MKILEIDKETYRVYGDSLIIHEQLAPAVYTVQFGKMTGFYLKKHSPLTVTEKLYGQHEKKIDKLVRSYDKFDRPMGVIFSGDKGIGKSIAARMLCEKMVAKGFPVIMVEDFFPGLTDFIDSIQQECVVLFDEFEKNFSKSDNDEDEDNSGQQDKLLSLFDGTSSNVKRLYLITCNNLSQLSDFMVNRPGRFHYHIRWHYPKNEEIEQYLKDKIDEKYYGEIPAVLNFAAKVKLNYDCLRAIAFELNLGEHFEDAINDMNIKNVDWQSFIANVQLKNGDIYTNDNVEIDFFSKVEYRIELYGKEGNKTNYRGISFRFNPIKAKTFGTKLVFNANDVKMSHYDGDGNRIDITKDIQKVWIEMDNEEDGINFIF